jgi:D-alanyl-D-alanine carboxypeptidase/D-alanyl-D-alanine-endopeptidase (penicillin-binding protein 4)
MNRLLAPLLFGHFFVFASPAFASEVEEETVSYSLDHVLGKMMYDSALNRTDYGVQVVNVHTGEEVFARNADQSLVPASVMKVLTGAVALRELGPGYKFATYVSTDATLDPEGILTGDLYVQGFGDPTLVTEDLWRLAYDLWLAGVRKVEGDVIYDDSFFDQDRLIDGWRKEIDMANGPAYFAPLGALSVNFNTACLVVGPGGAAGEEGSVTLEAPSDSIQVSNRVKTGSRRSRASLAVIRSKKGGGKVEFKVSGTVPLGAAPSKLYRTVIDPLDQFMSVFGGHLDERGIEVMGAHRGGKVGDGKRILARKESASLPTVLARMNKHSSNFVAEHVLKAVGAEVFGAPGTTEKGLRVIADYLESLGADSDEFTLVNGSGLSRDIELRPSHINSVMIDMAADRLLGPEFTSSLAIGGVDGTLWTRFRGEGVEGRVRGKTGSLNHVHGLTAYVDGGDGELYAFTFLVNDIPTHSRAIRSLHTRFGQALLDL